MTRFRRMHCAHQGGFLMLEVLITLVILVVGLLGLVGLQARAQQFESESYQRTQALMLLRDIADRINANRANAASYVTGTTYGTGYSPNCSNPGSVAAADLCAWHTTLLGAAETSGGTCGASGGINCVGAMIGARGCITTIGTDTYLVQVVWQGLVQSAAPPNSTTCGSGSYGNENQRRVVTTVVQIANLN